MQLSLIPDLVAEKPVATKLPKTRQLMLSLYAPKIEPKTTKPMLPKPQDLFLSVD